MFYRDQYYMSISHMALIVNMVHYHQITFKDWYALNPNQPTTTEWNNKIVDLEKTTWFHFRLRKTGFLFLLQTTN